MESPQPSLRSRMVMLLIGPWYVLIIAASFSQITDTPPAISLAIVVGGAAIIMVTLVVFGVKALQHTGQVWRFRLSTVLLVVIPLSVYFAAIRVFLSNMPVDDFTIGTWFGVAAMSVLFIVISTALLLCFAEALMWLALAVLRLFLPSRGGRSDGAADKR